MLIVRDPLIIVAVLLLGLWLQGGPATRNQTENENEER